MTTASDFMVGLLDLVFFLFDKSDNLILIISFAILFFCAAIAIIRRLMMRF